MAELNETPRGNRVHIAFFGLRNAGKSTLVNAFTGQPIAIVSDVPGTTTDPVSKAMEILPLGPCLITDTAGLDDEGELGEQRVAKTLKVLETTDIAVWVNGRADCPQSAATAFKRNFVETRLRRAEGCAPYQLVAKACGQRKVPLIIFNRGESVEDLKKKIAAVKLEEPMPGLLDGLVKRGDRVLCVVPIDESAPKGRLILPQQQVIRECLDKGLVVTVCQPSEVPGALCLVPGAAHRGCAPYQLVITDSQAFGQVRDALADANFVKDGMSPEHRGIGASDHQWRVTSFSILFARQKGDLAEYVKGLAAIKALKDGDTVLVAEGCTHHRQCNDIGTVKIPKALEKLSGKKLKFEFASGGAFDLRRAGGCAPYRLAVHCGGCMLTRREMLKRIALAKEAGVPIVNYGLVLAMANGIDVESLTLKVES